MRIHYEDSEAYIRSLAASISKDPRSLDSWYCLHVQHEESTPAEWYQETVRKLKEAHRDLDCDVVYCSMHNILIISRELDADKLYDLAEELMAEEIEGRKRSKVALYDLFHDWRTIHGPDLSQKGNAQDKEFDFGEVESLSEVFKDARKVRKARHPLHIMLVEDDALTRRIVSSSFKDNYALISAKDAHEAVANYLLHAPDIVFLDIGLPDASGFDVLKRIMKSDPDAFVVMFSANSYLDNITSALDAGASGFVAKPFNKQKLHRYIEESAMHHGKSRA